MLTEMGPHSERLQKVGNRGWRGMSSSHPKRCCIILGFRRSPWPQGPLKSAPRERVGFKNQHQHPRTQSQIQGERDKYVAWPFNCVQLSAIPWTVACQSPLPMRFLRQEYWKGLPFPTPGDLPKAGIELRLLHWQVDSWPLGPAGKPTRASMTFLILTFPPTLSMKEGEEEEQSRERAPRLTLPYLLMLSLRRERRFDLLDLEIWLKT